MSTVENCPKCGTRMNYQPILSSSAYVCPKCHYIAFGNEGTNSLSPRGSKSLTDGTDGGRAKV